MTTSATEQLFAAPDLDWQRVSPAYRTYRRLATLIIYLPPIIACSVALGFFTKWYWGLAILIPGLLFTGWRWYRMDLIASRWGYVEREEDLYITQGVWFRSLTAVPYGRMQAVEVSSGPIERLFHISHVQLITAATLTNAVIPGLPPEEAKRLRDRLTELGQNQAAGL